MAEPCITPIGYIQKGIVKIRDVWKPNTKTFRTFENTVEPFSIILANKLEDNYRRIVGGNSRKHTNKAKQW